MQHRVWGPGSGRGITELPSIPLKTIWMASDSSRASCTHLAAALSRHASRNYASGHLQLS